MKRIFKVRKPNPAKAKAQPHAAERKPAGDPPVAASAQPAQAADSKTADAKTAESKIAEPKTAAAKTKEVGGPEGPEPTRYGDWERGGICYDF